MPQFLRDLKQTVLQRESLVMLFAVALLCIVQYHRGLGLDRFSHTSDCMMEMYQKR